MIAGNTGFDGEVQNYIVVTSDMSAFYDPFERNQVYVDGGIFTMALVEALHYYGIASCILQNGEYKETLSSKKSAKIYQIMRKLFCLLQLAIIRIILHMLCHIGRT